jgi:hypothetical protein
MRPGHVTTTARAGNRRAVVLLASLLATSAQSCTPASRPGAMQTSQAPEGPGWIRRTDDSIPLDAGPTDGGPAQEAAADGGATDGGATDESCHPQPPPDEVLRAQYDVAPFLRRDDDARPGLAGASACARALEAGEPDPSGQCAWPNMPVVLGIHRSSARLGVITMRESAEAGEECLEARAEIVAWETLANVSSKKLNAYGPCAPFELAATKFAAALDAEGFVEPRDLVMLQAPRWDSVDGREPLALLRAPLCGWMVHAAPNAARNKIAVNLVSPRNDTRTELGGFAIDSDIIGGQRVHYDMTTVHEVILTPDPQRLVVTVAASYRGHNINPRYHRAVYQLPPNAKAALSPSSR